IELSNLQYFVNNKNCYDDQKSFVACVAGLNGFAQGLKEHDEKFYPEEYLKTHADSISLEIKSYPDLILAQKNKTHNQESKDNPFSAVVKLQKKEREEYVQSLISLFNKHSKIDFDGLLT